MKNSYAREMILVIILSLVEVLIVFANFIFLSFSLEILSLIILIVVFALTFLFSYILKYQKVVRYSFILLFTLNAIFHLIYSTNAFKTYDSTHVLESTCTLLYLIGSSIFFLSYLLFLTATTLEVKRVYMIAVIAIYASSAAFVVYFVTTIIACNNGIYEWGECFRPILFAFMFVLIAVLCDGEYVKDSFKFMTK